MNLIDVHERSEPQKLSRENDVVLLAHYLTSQCRNVNSRQSYFKSVMEFLNWRAAKKLGPIASTQPVEVALWVQMLIENYAVASVRLKLAAIRGFLDWMVVNHLISHNPARSVRGPKETLTKGKTPVLSAPDARALLDAIPVHNLIGLRDKAIIALMLYTFARIGAVLAIKRDDVFQQERRTWVRLNEKGGKVADLPCHHELDEILSEYLGRYQFNTGQYIFQSVKKNSCVPSGRRLLPVNFYSRVKKYARDNGFPPSISNHSFRATGITAFLKNNGTLEMAAKIANHSSTKTTQLYDRRWDGIVLGEVERIRFE